MTKKNENNPTPSYLRVDEIKEASRSIRDNYSDVLRMDSFRSEIDNVVMEIRNKKCYLDGLMSKVCSIPGYRLLKLEGRLAILPSYQEKLGKVAVKLIKIDFSVDHHSHIFKFTLTLVEDPNALVLIDDLTDEEKKLIRKIRTLWDKYNETRRHDDYINFVYATDDLFDMGHDICIVHSEEICFDATELEDMLNFLVGADTFDYLEKYPVRLQDFK